ncbi:phosphate--AMP phosphotransferase [Macrococcus armenti]|uniref:phosphate--AMP phosphotransferase n=1 Tax=Macrococcus armenti TaxID=2875764 RepID=UPI001CCAAC0D|nr:phosphate--AMP phosphotransferase [Macrococcus armenti]UBH15112.1 phosphate--AMP phosphotransferase [Macrococcus armenti]UBH17473.1 phosphate--AMP phosphotransferase [Macrococcus armenti]UBH19737.1 phosphate--AMP phosphotransferase [Macrococcus armenti]UBH22105.1 phosphate--AMP phosphotransferase [Macrococcus armenti]
MTKIDEQLQLKTAELVRQTNALGIPVMVIFEGIPASGKSRLSNELLLTLDAKYTNFYATKRPDEELLRYPFLYPYWNNIPKKGGVTLFFRSWYAQKLDYEVHGYKKDIIKDYELLTQEIKGFESMLSDDGYVIIKFYLSVNEQKRQEHIEQTKKNPLTRWKAQEYETNIPIDVYQDGMVNLMKATEEIAPWTHIDYTERGKAANEMYEVIIKRLEKALKDKKKISDERDGKFTEDFQTDMFEDTSDDMSKAEYKELLPKLQARIRELQYALYERKIPLMLVYEGMDAAGKGGNIKRVRESLDPSGYEVNAISAPTETELSYHYLWRFATDVPRSGHIEIFDRSWYGRVLVERVEGFATTKEWQRAYDEINKFEKALSIEGAIVIKFFLVLDKDEQLKRFEERQVTPEKQWKITDEDWRNREKWDLYLEASKDMINHTTTEHAPWVIIPANNKRAARIKALKTIIATCEERLWNVKKLW